ncbi:MAG: hypothetical protein ACRDK0_06550, partial [Solirubrobacteraceae bacterium]
VLGALARWGYDWTWGAPRPGEDVNIGAIFRLAPGMLTPPAGLEGTVELVVDARGDLPERRFQLALDGGAVEITEHDETETEPDARVGGPVSAWVHALGPEGSAGELQVTGKAALAAAVLDGFARAGARRALAAA